jgi:hypothetical protein
MWHNSDYILCNQHNSMLLLWLPSENRLRTPSSVWGTENRRDEISTNGCMQLIPPGGVDD